MREKEKSLLEDPLRISERESELHLLRAYAELERNALTDAYMVFTWLKKKRKPERTFAMFKNKMLNAANDLFEVLLWRRGGIPELFFDRADYRMERMGSGNSPDMMELMIAEELLRLADQMVTDADPGDPIHE